MQKYLDIAQREAIKRNRYPVQSHWASKLSRMAKCETCEGQGRVPDPKALAGGPPFPPIEQAPQIECGGCSGVGRILHGQCMRATFWHWIGTPPSDETETGGALKMLFGSATHDVIEELLGRAVATLPEYRLSAEIDGLRFPIVAKGDDIVLVPDEGCVDVIEIKSVADGQMYHLQPNHEVRSDWFLQACVGAKLWNDQFPHLPVRNMHFLVIARGNANRYEAVRPATPETLEEVVVQCVERCVEAEAWVLRAARGENVLPPAEFKDEGWTHWRCRISGTKKKDGYCPYRTMCHRIEETPDGPCVLDGADEDDQTTELAVVG